jgi:NADPH2:quinone reductase
MQAVLIDKFGSYENGRLAEIPTPTPDHDELVIEVHAAPVNYVDLVVAAGKYQFAPPLPYTPGKGPAGKVVAVGSDVRDFHLGDRVLAMAETGGFAQYAKVSQTNCFHIPNEMSFAEAGAMSLTYDTAWFALRDRAQIEAGDIVLVLGASGGVGRACLQLVNAMGGRAIAAVSQPDRSASVKEAGASAVVDLSGPDLRDGLRDQVYALTGGKGVDIVIDMIGGDAFDAAIRCVAWRGRVVIVGFAAGRIPVLKVNYLMLKNIAVSGLQVSDYRKRRPDMMAQCYRELFALHEKGKLNPGVVTKRPLAEFKDAFRAIETRTATGRIVLLPFDQT